MDDIRFQVAIAAYVFIGAMGLAFGMVTAAYALSFIRTRKADQ